MLEDASFRDASLRFARLPRSLLDGADFSAPEKSAERARAPGSRARFRVAPVRSACSRVLFGIGARFVGVAGGQADFTEAMLEDASFRDASLRFARLPRRLVSERVTSSRRAPRKVV
jgi:uncharacterized protein YjbI with pentapeptide repeats